MVKVATRGQSPKGQLKEPLVHLLPGLPRSGKKIWKMKFFLGQGKVREFCG